MGLDPGKKLIRHDRELGVRFVAGADEVGRGSLAGPLAAAAVVLDLNKLRGSRTRVLYDLRDSKQLDLAARERLLLAVLALSELVVVDTIPAREIDRCGLQESNLEALERALRACVPPAEVCLVDGAFSLGPGAPPHSAVVGGDAKSAAIACASIVAKVVRDRMMRRLDAVYPAYGFADHVGYITRAHAAAVSLHGPCAVHRLSFQAACYQQSA